MVGAGEEWDQVDMQANDNADEDEDNGEERDDVAAWVSGRL